MTNDVMDWPVDDLTAERRADLKRDLMSELTRQGRRQRRLRLTAAALVVTAAGSTAAGVLLSSPPTATAAWTAVPSPTAISVQDPLIQQCLAELPTGAPAQTGRAELTPVVAETRGASRAALLDGDDSQAVCIATPTTRNGGRTLAPPLKAGADLSLAGNGGSSDGSGARYVYGRVSGRVASVEVRTTSGLHVTSSVAHGAYVAWWPGGQAPAKITASDANGTALVTLTPKSE